MDFDNEILNIVCNEDGIDSARLIKEASRLMPDEFYRYRAVNDFNLDALQNGYEYLSTPNAYNDPLDAKLFYDGVAIVSYITNKLVYEKFGKNERDMLRGIIGESFDFEAGRLDKQLLNSGLAKIKRFRSIIEKFSKEMEEAFSSLPNDFDVRLEEHIREQSLICSFSTKYDNQLMWAHYANEHKGYCLEYDRPDPKKFDYGFFLPVVYRKSPVDVTRFLKMSFPNGVGAARAFLGGALVKNECWSYEDEWRYIRTGDIKNRHLKAFIPKRLLLGCRADEKTESILKEYCQQLGLPMYQMVLSKTAFEMEVGDRII